jgi:bis(5'-nucleosyl)-tetraphosphatase (symmetrical)
VSDGRRDDSGVPTFAIGDAHGCTRTLRRLIDRLPFDPAHDRLWLVGDLAGHGPDSLGTLRMIHELEDELGPRLAVVLGNHDLRLLAARAGADVPRPVAALLAKILASSDGESLLDWLGRRPLLHRDDETVMVHAGLLPSWTVAEAMERAGEVQSILASRRRELFLVSLTRERADDAGGDRDLERPLETTRVMTRVRTVEADGKMCGHKGPPESAPAHCRPWFAFPERAHRGTTVVFGHWAALGLRLGADWLALDSGVAWGGPLTAVRLDDRRVFQEPRID